MTTPTMSPEQIQLMIDLMPSAQSLRDIAAIMGVKQQTLRYVATPFVALLRMQGALPPCECGKERFHRYGCSATAAKAVYASGVYGQSPERAAAHRARREQVVEAIMSGDAFSVIEKRLGMKPKTSRKYLPYLTPAQREIRKQLEKQRDLQAQVERERGRQEKKERRRKAEAPAPRPFSDPIYARIADAVPRWLSPGLRDDVISEMYVAVLEGVLAESEVTANANRFASAALAQFESKFGPRSINEKLSADSELTLADRLPDPAALQRFDELDGLRVGRRHQPEEVLSL